MNRKTKFIIKFNKELNEYYYLSNLALEGKKHWVRKEYNQAFLSLDGPLTIHETSAINKLQEIISFLEKSNINLLDFFVFQSPGLSYQNKFQRTGLMT